LNFVLFGDSFIWGNLTETGVLDELRSLVINLSSGVACMMPIEFKVDCPCSAGLILSFVLRPSDSYFIAILKTSLVIVTGSWDDSAGESITLLL
jgi:hypothetical protein